MNNEFLKMQKLAGLITEGQYKANLNEMSEENLVSTLKENGFEVSSNPAWIVRNSETGDDYILYTESGDYISHKLDGDFPEGVKIMGEGADDWLEQFLETEKKTELTEVDDEDFDDEDEDFDLNQAFKDAPNEASYEDVLDIIESYEMDDVLEDFKAEFPEGEPVSKDDYSQFGISLIDDMSEVDFIQANWISIFDEDIYEKAGLV
jgi:hypothetical protein